MIQRYVLVVTLAVTLLGLVPGGVQAAASRTLPPGIAAQAQPLIDRMMQQCEQAGMSGDGPAMMADMQAMANRVPPGIFLNILQAMSRLSMTKMMAVHQQIREGGLLEQPPGRILQYVRDLAR